MNRVILSRVAFVIMSVNIYAGDIQEPLDISYNGAIRVGYQNSKIDKDSDDEIALGVKLHIETAPYSSLQLGATLFTSQGDGKANFEGIPFFDENGKNYATLAEAYLKGEYDNTIFILGRQELETPFAQSDDVGMIPNSFEALTLINKDIPNTTLFLSQVQKWSGVDSNTPSKFTNLNGNDGMQILGINYDGVKNSRLSGWFYLMKSFVKLLYLETEYTKESDTLRFGFTTQYILQDYKDNTKSTIYGVSGSLGFKSSGLTTSIAYNKTDGRGAENFFGGGPFVSNAEHHTLSEAGRNGDDTLYTVEWDSSTIGLDGVVVTLKRDIHSSSIKEKSANEYDFIINYSYSNRLNFSAIYSDIDDREDSFKNLRVFANYLF